MAADCQMSTAHEAAARMRSKPKISLRSRGNGEALAVVRPRALFVTNCHGDAGGKGMRIFRPDFFVRIHAWNSVDRHLHEAGNLNRAMLALFLEGDGHGFGTKHRRDERRQGCDWTANGPREDGLQGLTLLLICSLIEVEGHGPVAISHRSRCSSGQNNIQDIKRGTTLAPLINVETTGTLTRASCRLRS